MSGDDIRVADVPVKDVWARLENEKTAVLIDVRTRSEWAFVGLPDLGSIGKRVLLMEWQTFPENKVISDFVTRLSAELSAAGTGHESELYFICRSGGRSLQSARAMAAAGYKRCFNVADGFEGPLDSHRHRGQSAGWKAAGLPWAQG